MVVNKKLLFLSIVVSLITAVVYMPSLTNQFVTWDDTDYIYDNPNIHHFNFSLIKWAFSSFYASNWHPLTWLSHAFDYAVWSLNPFGHHLTNLILHVINTFLVTVITTHLCTVAFNQKTDTEYYKYAGLITGILFGIHPLHVESVAWVSERKDLLCALFFLSGILLYTKYLKSDEHKCRYYILILFVFILALLSKPMAVTLPIVLLIMDFYPFNRFSENQYKPAVIEKLPFFLIGAGSAIVTFLAQQSGGAIASLDRIPLMPRLLNAFKAVIVYIQKMLWPSDLIPFYPYPSDINAVSLSSPEYILYSLSVISIIIYCFLIYFLRNKRLFIVVWSYYISTLLPVLGIIKIGAQSMADRYTYLPGIGPFLLFAILYIWLAKKISDYLSDAVIKKILFFLPVFVIVISLAVITLKQIRIWKNGETLWSREIQSEPNVAKAYLNRGKYYTETGNYVKALNDFSIGISLKPLSPDYYYNRGTCFLKLGNYRDALNDLTKAIFLSTLPSFNIYNNRAITYVKLHLFNEAINDYTLAISINNQSPELYYNRGNAYAKTGLYKEALNDYLTAIQLSPEPNPDYYHNRDIVYDKLTNAY